MLAIRSVPVGRAVVALGLGAALFLTACSGAGYGAPPASTTPAPASGAAVTIATASDPNLGLYLVGPDGLALYTKSGDSATTSTCSGGCATAWPPLMVEVGQVATGGAGATGAFGTLTRADGTLQVTYQGLPLYYWQGDTKAGDVTGDGVGGFSLATVGGARESAAPSSTASGKYNY